MHRDNWDDLRFVLAVAEDGSVNAAARRLGVNHATVLRRISAFEDREGMQIFDRTALGYRVPPEKLALIHAAREVEQAVQAARRVMRGADAPLSGRVRITSTDTFCQTVLPEILPALHAEAPGLTVEMVCSNAHVDLAKLDADVTVRPALVLPDGLTGASPAQLGFDVYAAPGTGEDWLGLAGAILRSRPGQYARDSLDPDRIVASADSFPALREMAARGLGQAIIPCILGDGDPRLVRRRGLVPDLSVDIWVACHPDLANTPRIRMVHDRLAAALAANAARLLGS